METKGVDNVILDTTPPINPMKPPTSPKQIGILNHLNGFRNLLEVSQVLCNAEGDMLIFKTILWKEVIKFHICITFLLKLSTVYTVQQK